MGSSNSTDSDSTYDECEAESTLTYAGLAYCDEAELLDWDCNRANSAGSFNTSDHNFNITSNGAGVISTDDLQAFMGYDNDENRIVLSIRGTCNDDNWWSNIEIIKDTYPHYDDGAGEVHRGFYTAWQSLEQYGLSTMIKSMFEGNPGADIMATGHSLGGTLAEIAAFDILHNPDYSSLSVGTVRVIDFGSPRWADETIATRYNEVVESNWRIVNQYDPVPQLPSSVVGYHHTGTMVHYLSRDLGDYAICDSSGEENYWNGNTDCWLLYADISDHTYGFNDGECTESGETFPLSMIQDLERDLKIPDKVPTVDVVVVAVMVFVMLALWRCGFRCSIWRKQQKPYKRVDLKGDVDSDSDTDVDVQAVRPVNF